jgi:uncharacterized damage-inducible protein DinB
MLPLFVRQYSLTTLAGAPDVLERLLTGIVDGDSVWDRRPDPARFTLREIVAHLADYNDVFLDRITRIRDEDGPSLTYYPPDETARRTGSFEAAPLDSMARFRAGRTQMVPVLQALEPGQWKRAGTLPGHPRVTGEVSIEDWIILIMGHDGYHMYQIADWLTITKND